MLSKSLEDFISFSNHTSQDILLIAACFNNWSINFFRQDFMRVGTQAALLYSKILPELGKQFFIVFFIVFIESKREDVFFLESTYKKCLREE